MKRTKLIGSASTLQNLKDLIKMRWYWDIITTQQDDKTWTVSNSKGPIEGCIIKLKSGRYRLEMLVV